MYANTAAAYGAGAPILPPQAMPRIVSTAPPNSCEYPVAITGSSCAVNFLQHMLDITVQKEAAIIKPSPRPKLNFSALVLIISIPKRPSAAPANFAMLNLSSLKNIKEKQIKNNTPSCFKRAVFELSVIVSPVYVKL